MNKADLNAQVYVWGGSGGNEVPLPWDEEVSKTALQAEVTPEAGFVLYKCLLCLAAVLCNTVAIIFLQLV